MKGQTLGGIGTEHNSKIIGLRLHFEGAVSVWLNLFHICMDGHGPDVWANA